MVRTLILAAGGQGWEVGKSTSTGSYKYEISTGFYRMPDKSASAPLLDRGK